MSQREQTLNRIADLQVSAIVRADDARVAADAMTAAVAGGFRMIEFTMTTPGVCGLIERFAERDDLLVGAGTVMDRQLAREAVAAGARFLVSPVTDPAVIEESAKLEAVSIPGASTPTEMMAAHSAGADIIKLFPAPADVVGTIVAVLGPLPFLKIFPTAGVSIENAAAVLDAGAFGAGFVRSLFVPEDIREKRYNAIEERARRIIELIERRRG